MFKDPDGVYESLKDADIISNDGKAKEGMEEAKTLVDKFVEYDEYVYLEFDTEAKTVRVMGADE